ncbi:MAG TPA: hypothetical protein VJP05_10460 [Acidimicrobiia bacterium]|nr:hypothetical protein [Acidimicrobiia bacterium]
MTVPLELDDLPAEARRMMERRAAVAGVEPAEYARRVLAEAATKPTVAELSARIKARGPVHLPEPSEVTVRRLRDWGE